MRLIVFQHDDHWGLGSFAELLPVGDASWSTVQLHIGEPVPADLAPYDAMVVLGGPMNVWQSDLHPWLRHEIEAISMFVQGMKRPFLGICLGHQLLSVALGGTVGEMKAPEIGVRTVSLTSHGMDDKILSRLGPSFPTFQWHHAQVTQVPADCTILAGTDLCMPQVIRWGDKAYGLQFHAEISAGTIASCQTVEAYAHALEKTIGVAGRERFVGDASEHLPRFRHVAERVVEGFLEIVSDSRRDRPTA